MSSAGAGGTFVPAIGVDASTSLQADLASSRAEIVRARTESITYVEDKVSKALPNAAQVASDYRIATAKCAKCASLTELHQSQDASGVWRPAEADRLSVFGWQTDGERWFCGKWCCEIYTAQMRDHGNKPLPPVTRVNDASYARRMYAEAPAETTPTRPPATSMPAQQTQMHGNRPKR